MISFLSCAFIFHRPLLLWAKDKYTRFKTITEVLNLVENNYVEKVNIDKLLVGGIKGILSELDPHTTFLTKKAFERFQDDSTGTYGGLGINITLREKFIIVIAPIEDSPAWKAGVKAGDKIIGINKQSIEGHNLSQVSEKLKGKQGTKVTLTILRKGLKNPKFITIKRGKIFLKSVKYKSLGDGYVYIRITSFINKTTKDLKRVLRKYMKKNKTIKGLVLDLRNNPGGLLSQAIKVSDLFLDKGDILSTIGRDKQVKKTVKSTKLGTYKGFPIVVLINAYSASASEIVAGALKDNKRALLIGKRSFGKGSVQTLIELHDGSALKLTVSRYYTPKGISIQAEGVKPDIEIKQIDLTTAYEKEEKKFSIFRENNIRGHLKKEDSLKTKNHQYEVSKKVRELLQKDYQLLEAYRYVKAFKTFESFSR